MPKKPLTQITQEELDQEAREGTGAQQTELDKLWYYMNYYSLYSVLQSAEEMSKDPADQVRNIYENQEEYQKAVEDYHQKNIDSYFMKGEQDRTHMPANRNIRKLVSNASDIIEEDVKQNVLRNKTMEDIQKSYKLLGLLQAKIAMECGKDYMKKLNALPENEEHREEKAEYLHMKDERSLTLIRANGNLLGSTLDYTKGKKSMRSFTSSQARFDNSIDVLSVANDHVPGFRRFAKQVADRTNAVRKVQPGDINYINLSKYGTARALKNAPKDSPAYQRSITAGVQEWLKDAVIDDAPENNHPEAGNLNI